ncbi:Histidine kinase-, DNA gyrase B-, and HSP90-like ATPase [Pedobacter suwonensis]|uniref:Histidine kinase-, DNA gyrase B-, and HSP90-like ATPase n=1 Tax=Pedobacter suwonensis TaxID=332999 RepID=A0A1I0TEG8_9SPHI|nr:ATP-binding protein [Pedobacter suwonensis]SFA50188.1 Histidine kinase-, DNA gyrase B-, and HSP90-like ATPase [Pedobacter suwonensis]
MENDAKLTLKFDPNTIEHLGISLYSKLPSVLSELISNSWDADSEKVIVKFYDNASLKEIFYQDFGEGMTFDELNEKYLLIGRNRRSAMSDITAKGRRVIGKKGLGKLAVFGICDEIEVISIKDGIENHFIMNLLDIKASQNNVYSPRILKYNEVNTKDNSGLILKLKQIRRKSGFNLEELAVSLSKKFLIFDQMETKLYLNDAEEKIVTNELKFNDLKKQFEWTFPDIKYDENYTYWSNIKGSIITAETPIKDTEMSGIYLTSRGKIVNTANFYGLRDNDQFHSYVTGYLEVDFIDEFDEDVISTDRHSLNWENDNTKDLQSYIQKVIKKIGTEWREKRSMRKRTEIRESSSLDIAEWQNSLPTYERELSNKIINPILQNANIDVEESKNIINNVIDKFENKIFKDYASAIADVSRPEDIPQLLKLMDDWKAIETRQFHDIAISRVEVIKQFEEYVDTNTKEVPTLHNFLKKFSWLLDPRILEFKDEVTYTKLLMETYPEDSLDLADRRIDFLCSNALGEILYVIEIKRSNFRVDKNALEQAYEYGAFLKDKYASQTGFSKVVCYVVGGSKSADNLFKRKEETYAGTGEVFVKTYRELLEQSKEYHKEFIDAYDKREKKDN